MKITEWDDGPEPGSLSFELELDDRSLVYVLRRSDGTYKHMRFVWNTQTLRNDVVDATDELPERDKSDREIAIAGYIAEHDIRAGRPITLHDAGFGGQDITYEAPNQDAMGL